MCVSLCARLLTLEMRPFAIAGNFPDHEEIPAHPVHLCRRAAGLRKIPSPDDRTTEIRHHPSDKADHDPECRRQDRGGDQENAHRKSHRAQGDLLKTEVGDR